jgi:hypothetical protein
VDLFGPDPVLTFSRGFLVLVVVYALITLAQWLKRRAALRAFAASHGLRFGGTLPSDKYAPYTAFPIVRSAVLLWLVTEGRWNDFDVALFDYRRHRRRASYFGVIVSLPNDGTCFQINGPTLWPRGVGPWETRVTLADAGLPSWVVVSEPIPGTAATAIGPRTAALLRDGPLGSLETNLGYLLVTPMPRIALEGVPGFLDYATSVARALGTDAQTR